MKKLLIAVTAAQIALVPSFALAEERPTPQQQRMRECNAQAQGMKGDARKNFMKQCLSGKRAEAKAAREERGAQRQAMHEERREERMEARQTQQEKMKTCNAKAKGMKGDARKAFMSDCLKN